MPVPTEKEIKEAISILRQVGRVEEIPYPDENFTVIILREKGETK